MNVFGVENRDTLTHKATGVIMLGYCIITVLCQFFSFSAKTLKWLLLFPSFFHFGQYSAKLLKKPDQCRAVYACSHLFWVDDQDGMKDGERFSALLLKITGFQLNNSMVLFVFLLQWVCIFCVWFVYIFCRVFSNFLSFYIAIIQWSVSLSQSLHSILCSVLASYNCEKNHRGLHHRCVFLISGSCFA